MTCSLCGLRIHKDNALGICSRSTCKNERQRQYAALRPDVMAKSYMKYYHGLTPDEWQAMWDQQQGLCYLCEQPLPPGRKTVIDHDHACCPKHRSCSRCRRGLACFQCNVAIGMTGDDPEKLLRIARNLEARLKVEIVG